MPEEKKMNTEDTEIVDIDTSGPEVEVNLDEEKKVEEPKETIQVEEAEPKQEIEVKEETKKEEVKEETEEKKKDTDEYSEGVVAMANFAKNARKFKKGQDGLETKELGGKDKIPKTDKSPEDLIKDGYKQDPDNPNIYIKTDGEKVDAVDSVLPELS